MARNFKGTLFLISHDRFFVERVGITKILNLKAGRLSEV
jgi:ATPase subunit of ABC transporter with duplicated ATPase domains